MKLAESYLLVGEFLPRLYTEPVYVEGTFSTPEARTAFENKLLEDFEPLAVAFEHFTLD